MKDCELIPHNMQPVFDQSCKLHMSQDPPTAPATPNSNEKGHIQQLPEQFHSASCVPVRNFCLFQGHVDASTFVPSACLLTFTASEGEDKREQKRCHTENW